MNLGRRIPERASSPLGYGVGDVREAESLSIQAIFSWHNHVYVVTFLISESISFKMNNIIKKKRSSQFHVQVF